jgi:hypothetical protein
LYFHRGDRAVTPQPYTREAQGEAVGFAADGLGYYTLSERGSDDEKNKDRSGTLNPKPLTLNPKP